MSMSIYASETLGAPVSVASVASVTSETSQSTQTSHVSQSTQTSPAASTDVVRFLLNRDGTMIPYGKMTSTAIRNAYDRLDNAEFVRSRISEQLSLGQNLIPMVVDTYTRLISKVWLYSETEFESLLRCVKITSNGKIRLARSESEIRRNTRGSKHERKAKQKYIRKHLLSADDVFSYLKMFQEKYPFITWQSMSNVTKQFEANIPTLRKFVCQALLERMLNTIGIKDFDRGLINDLLY